MQVEFQTPYPAVYSRSGSFPDAIYVTCVCGWAFYGSTEWCERRMDYHTAAHNRREYDGKRPWN